MTNTLHTSPEISITPSVPKGVTYKVEHNGVIGRYVYVGSSLGDALRACARAGYIDRPKVSKYIISQLLDGYNSVCALSYDWRITATLN